MAKLNIVKTKSQNYTVVSNHHLFDTALSLEAKGLLTLALSKSIDGMFSTKNISQLCAEDIASVNVILKELEENRYVQKE